MNYVKYIGLAHRRGILAEEWASVGIQAETVWWDYTNAFMVPADQFTDEQIRKVINPDTSFVIIGTDDEPQRLERDMTPSEAAQPRIRLREIVQGDAVGTNGAERPENPSTGVSGASTAGPRRTTGRGSGKDG